ncbi:tetratricopeptide repeat-containing sensor histidine kinase [uncultured Flavobacterium sp.]|uniref:tetratricopeptide repeat-containing sensor histidine kinase n=1 Tax=uncultured Flavobacterium sp. TaxID=165435 RepID=UPI002616FB9F|nr:tetratricopeptide repeat-containing sensor histidine kinase [uncultured Flavobacterium sp.]
MKKILYLILATILIFSCKEKKSFSNTKSILNAKFNILSDSKKIQYLDSVISPLEKIDNDSLKLKFLFEVAAEYYYLNNNKSSFKVSNQIYVLSKKINDSISMGRALYYMGDCYEKYQKDSAYFYYKESEKIFRAIKDNEKLAKALFNKAHLLFTEGNYVESEVEVIKALNKLQSSKKYIFLYECYYLQAANHTELGEYDQAIKYLNLALDNLKKDNSLKDTIAKYEEYNILVTIAFCNIYDKKGDFNRSIFELEKLVKSDVVVNHPKLHSTVLGNLAFDYMKIGKFEIAKRKYIESIAMSKHFNDSQGYLYKIINFGEYHLLQSDTMTANKYFIEALPLTKQLKSNNELLKTLNFLSISDKKNAAFYKNEYVKVFDSIVKQQRLNREKFARIEYETSKVEDENKILSTNNLLLILGLALSIVVFLTAIIIKEQIARKKELLLIKQKEQANDELLSLIKEFQFALIHAKEEEQNRISKELHDGIVNQIYAIRMVLDTLNDEDDEITKEKRIVYIKELHKVESEIRSLSHELYSDFSIYDSNYLFLIHSLVKSNNDLNETVFTVSISDSIDWKKYSSIVKINLYRILQELFLNVNKYAQATVCNLVIVETTDFLLITVEDDGIGFDKNHTTDGIGLKNINERIKTIDAQISIETAVGKGVRVSIKIKRDL